MRFLVQIFDDHYVACRKALVRQQEWLQMVSIGTHKEGGTGPTPFSNSKSPPNNVEIVLFEINISSTVTVPVVEYSPPHCPPFILSRESTIALLLKSDKGEQMSFPFEGYNSTQELATSGNRGLQMEKCNSTFCSANMSLPILGTPVCTIIDEFLEKFQTAFDPPPSPFLGKMLRFFSTKIFGTEMTPPNWRF